MEYMVRTNKGEDILSQLMVKCCFQGCFRLFKSNQPLDITRDDASSSLCFISAGANPPADPDPALLASRSSHIKDQPCSGVQKHLYAKLIMIRALLRLNLNTHACEELPNYVNPFPW